MAVAKSPLSKTLWTVWPKERDCLSTTERKAEELPPLVAKLQTVKECETLARNAEARSRKDIAALARRRAIQIRTGALGANSEVERECIEAVLAYEDARSHLSGKRITASRTWPMIKRHGAVEAIERVVKRASDAAGYKALLEMGLESYSFEAVVLRHPESFSPEAAARSRDRLEALQDANHTT